MYAQASLLFEGTICILSGEVEKTLCQTKQNIWLVSLKEDRSNEKMLKSSKVTHSCLICDLILKFFWKNRYEENSHGITDCDFCVTELSFRAASHIDIGHTLYPLRLLKILLKVYA